MSINILEAGGKLMGRKGGCGIKSALARRVLVSQFTWPMVVGAICFWRSVLFALFARIAFFAQLAWYAMSENRMPASHHIDQVS
jgi:hypothetical protein